MDTLIKVKFTIGDKIGNMILNEKEVYANVYPRGAAAADNIQFDEFKYVRVHFECSDPQAILEIESFDADNEEGVQQLRPGKEIVLVQGGDNMDMFSPGDYYFLVKTSSGLYEGNYSVIPKSTTLAGIENLRNYIEKFCKGLTLNLNKQKYGDVVDMNGYTSSIVHLYNRLIAESRPMLHNINSIINNPIQQEEKEYKLRGFSKKPDIKSNRWLSKRGNTYDNSSFSSAFYYEKHTALSLNTIENLWVRKILDKIQAILRQVDRSYENLSSDVSSRMQKKISEKENLIKSYRDIIDNHSSFYAKEYAEEIYRKINDYETDILCTKNTLDNVNSKRRKIKSLIGNLSYCVHETWLNELDNFSKASKPSIRLLKDIRYAYLYNLYKDLTREKKSEKSAKSVIFPYKKTSLLLEYLSLFWAIEIIQSYGFKWVKGWLAEVDNPSAYIADLQPDTELFFEKGEYYIKIHYDTEIKPFDDSKNGSRFISINSKHNRPDICIALHKNTGELLDAIIIEVKYRREYHIFDRKNLWKTKVSDQINDYLNFWYFDSIKGKMNKNPISKVITLYTKQNDYPIHKALMDSLIYLQISAPGENEEAYGYNELKELIYAFIKKEL